MGMPERTFSDYLKRLVRQRAVIKSATGDEYYRPSPAK